MELEHDLHSVYTVHSALYNIVELEAKSSGHTVDTKCRISGKKKTSQARTWPACRLEVNEFRVTLLGSLCYNYICSATCTYLIAVIRCLAVIENTEH